MEELSCKLLVVGGGPGGYVAAIRAGQLGVDTILVEQEALGGTCLNIGCIPSKALIHAADEFYHVRSAANGPSPIGISLTRPEIDFGRTIDWKDAIVKKLTGGVGGLLRKAKVRLLTGRAHFLDGKTVEIRTEQARTRIKAEAIVIATGSEPVELPNLRFGGKVLSSTEALSLREVPKKLVIVGGGYIGLEIGTAYRKLGTDVTIIEAGAQILPVYDPELTRPISDRLKALGVTIMTSTEAVGLNADQTELLVRTNDQEVSLPMDHVLVTVGRRPRLSGFGLEDLQLSMNGRFLKIDRQCLTSMRGVYAIGDVTGDPMLAHRAMAQGELVAEIVAGRKPLWDKRCVPAVCFTDPELVTVGLLPEEARSAGIDTVVGLFPFRGNGRSLTREREDGFVRIVARKDDHVILGIQAVGAGISELVNGFSLAIEMGSRLEDIAETIHAHPTAGEAFQEASLVALGRGLHI
jgi:dihydrolipoamide dehydrogenase